MSFQEVRVKHTRFDYVLLRDEIEDGNIFWSITSSDIRITAYEVNASFKKHSNHAMIFSFVRLSHYLHYKSSGK